MPSPPLPLVDGRAHLRADCANCAALCCVAPAFSASADFAIDKPAGRPCPNLRDDDLCGIHDRLRDRGLPGCAVLNCFGAGQHVTQGTFAGRTWRETPGLADRCSPSCPSCGSCTRCSGTCPRRPPTRRRRRCTRRSTRPGGVPSEPRTAPRRS